MATAQQKSASGCLSNGSNGQTKQDLAVQHHQLCKQVQILKVSYHLHPPIEAVELWTLLADSEKRIQAFEAKCLRKLLRLYYLEHKNNDWVRSKISSLVGPHEPHLATVKRRILFFFKRFCY